MHELAREIKFCLKGVSLMTPQKLPFPIVFFDGECAFCQRSVLFILKRLNPHRPLYFAPLKGESFKLYQNYLKAQRPSVAQKLPSLEELSGHSGTLVYATKDQAYLRKLSLQKILVHLHGPYPLVGKIVSLLPAILLNPIYRVVARHRKHLVNSCSFISHRVYKDYLLP